MSVQITGDPGPCIFWPNEVFKEMTSKEMRDIERRIERARKELAPVTRMLSEVGKKIEDERSVRIDWNKLLRT